MRYLDSSMVSDRPYDEFWGQAEIPVHLLKLKILNVKV